MDTPKKTCSQMSSSLKERLKRCGRYHASPKPLTCGSRQPSTCGARQPSTCGARQPSTCGAGQPSTCGARQPSTCGARQPSTCGARQPVRDLCYSKTSTETSKSPLRRNSENVVKELSRNETSSKPSCDTGQLLYHRSPSKHFEVEMNAPIAKIARLSTPECNSRSSNTENHSSVLAGDSNLTDVSSDTKRLEHTSKSFHAHAASKSICSKSKSLSKVNTSNVTASTTKSKQDEFENSGAQNRTVDDNLKDVGPDTIDTTDHADVVTSDANIYKQLMDTVREKEETLRKLRMVKMYRSKNDLTQLQGLIDKWRGVSQQGLHDLHQSMPEPKPTLTQLVDHLGIDHTLIQYDPEEESFG